MVIKLISGKTIVKYIIVVRLSAGLIHRVVVNAQVIIKFQPPRYNGGTLESAAKLKAFPNHVEGLVVLYLQSACCLKDEAHNKCTESVASTLFLLFPT